MFSSSVVGGGGGGAAAAPAAPSVDKSIVAAAAGAGDKIRPYKCATCDRTFINSNELSRHVRLVHHPELVAAGVVCWAGTTGCCAVTIDQHGPQHSKQCNQLVGPVKRRRIYSDKCTAMRRDNRLAFERSVSIHATTLLTDEAIELSATTAKLELTAALNELDRVHPTGYQVIQPPMPLPAALAPPLTPALPLLPLLPLARAADHDLRLLCHQPRHDHPVPHEHNCMRPRGHQPAESPAGVHRHR
jgi:hypothetical protein